jgi:hypothetical protein
VESGEQAVGDHGDAGRASRSPAARVGSLPRRGAQYQRMRLRGARTGALSSAVSRLEQEHLALLLALCDLEEPGANAAANAEPMRSALLVVLREDLRRTQHALALAARGVFGLCEECHRPLSRRHLDLTPAATRCGICASAKPAPATPPSTDG